MARSIIIYITGMDGSGKTTIAKILEYQLRKLGLPVVRIWFRFPYFALYPLLFLARIFGFTKIYRLENKSFTIHLFEAISKIYILLFLFDFTLNYLFRIKVRTLLPIVLIVDRGPLDNVIDLQADISNFFPQSKIFTYMLKLQQHGLTLYASSKFNTIKKRRPEINLDPKGYYRYLMYKIIIKRFKEKLKYIALNTEKSIQDNISLLQKLSFVVRRNYGHIGYGKRFKNPYLRALFASKWFILINWLVQGTLIADSVENIIRFVSDLLVFTILFIYTNELSISILGLILCHTINYLINSNSPILFVYLNQRIDHKTCLKKIKYFINKNEPTGIKAVCIFGSLSLNMVTYYSDIDIRIIRKPGFLNAIKAFLWTARLRLYAHCNNLPLDVFISKNWETKHINYKEKRYLICIYNEENGNLNKISKS